MDTIAPFAIEPAGLDACGGLFDPFMPPCHLMPWACMPTLPWVPTFPLPWTWVDR
jgi:hypothetical protein